MSSILNPVRRAWRDLRPGTRRTIVGLAFSALSPVLSAFVTGWLDSELHVTAPNMIFLCSVIFSAIWFGRAVGFAAALFSFFIYNFYLTEPRNTFGFAGFEDVLTLLVFVGVALLVGGLAGNLHDARRRAEEQVRIFSDLFEVTRPLAECADEPGALRLLAQGARRMAADRAMIVQSSASGPSIFESAGSTTAPPAAVFAEALTLIGEARNHGREVHGWQLQPICAGGACASVLAWLPARRERRDQLIIAVRLLTELTGLAIERTHHVQRQVEIDTLAATDRLRAALMSSMSHDFRTPLATILASASSLLAYGPQFSSATHADLLSSIQEEAERLNRFISNIMDMNKLEAGVLAPRKEWADPIEIIENLEERMKKRLGGRSLTVETPAAVPSLFVDPLLLEQALVNVVENAIVHTTPACSISMGVAFREDAVDIWVSDDGPGVPANELDRVFEKFYRAPDRQQSNGVGLGLAISKGFIEAMEGEVIALSPTSSGRGLKVCFRFARQRELASA